MRQLNHYCFSLENVVVQSLHDALEKIMQGRGESQKRYDLTLALSLGKISPDDFWKEILSSSTGEVKISDLQEKVGNSLEPIDGTLKVLTELKKENTLSLFSQLPRELFASVKKHFGLQDLFADSDIFFTNEMNLKNTTADVVNYLIAGKCLNPGKSVVVDADSRRTSAAIRAGMDAIIFVDARRLRREIALRGLLPKLGDE